MKRLAMAVVVLMCAGAAQAAEQAALQTIAIPHDPGASHALVEKSGNVKQRVVVTRREGLLGVLYSRHVYNCERHTVALLGTGESLESLNSHPVRGSMLPVVSDTTAYYIEAEACS